MSWHRGTRQWRAQLRVKGSIQNYEEHFKEELDAAKRVNKLCEAMNIPLRNPGIAGIPTQQYRCQVT